MTFRNEAAPRRHEVAVVGAGAVGLSLALGLGRAGVDTVLIGPPPVPRPGRTVALLGGSVRLLEAFEVWPRLAAQAAPLARMRIVDATGSLFRSPPVQFDSAELGLAAFGFNIANDDLERGLAADLAGVPAVGVLQAPATGFRFGDAAAVVEIEGGASMEARLVIAADGRHSLARKSARIGVRARSWPQTALTALFRHAAPHRDTSVEFHTRAGPFTLVPLPGTGAAPHRSSLVWVMSPDDARRRRADPAGFARKVEAQADRLLGAMSLDSEIGSFPIATSVSTRLTGPRLVLTGEAAHALPPIGAQGLNLSLRDVAELVETLAAAVRRGDDPGERAVLDRYEAGRRGDLALRSLAVDSLNGSLLAQSPFVDLARGAGLAALAAFGPLRRAVMRRGLVAPEAAVPPRT